MSVQHAEPANPPASDPDQSPHQEKDDPASAAALSPPETIVQLTQALHRTQAALAASEERLNLALTGADAGIWDWDTLTGALHWTPQMERLYGLPAGSIRVHADWTRCVVPEDLARIQFEQSAALAQHIPFKQSSASSTATARCVGFPRAGAASMTKRATWCASSA